VVTIDCVFRQQRESYGAPDLKRTTGDNSLEKSSLGGCGTRRTTTATKMAIRRNVGLIRPPRLPSLQPGFVIFVARLVRDRSIALNHATIAARDVRPKSLEAKTARMANFVGFLISAGGVRSRGRALPGRRRLTHQMRNPAPAISIACRKARGRTLHVAATGPA
jgi:hypothetical protein